jgi:hypothetical protein
LSRITQIIETLEAEKADLQRRLDWVDGQLDSFREHASTEVVAAGSAPKRSTRRATARRASSKRATARKLKRDLGEEIVLFLEQHPNSTAGDIAKGLNLNRNSVATRLTQMTKAGTIAKAERGYAPLSTVD